jgi:hypothetical protein
MESTFNDLYRHIEKIKHKEMLEHKMLGYIEARFGSLHKTISINSVDPVATLFEFTTAYIDSAYDYLDAIYTLAVESKTTSYLKPFINLALMFFIKPPELLTQYRGTQRLLYQAYLSNRLLEELNDQITSISPAPLSPMDISMDNIVCHALIGDELANQLDHLVFLVMETTVSDRSVFEQPQTQLYLERTGKGDWRQIKQRWPCFANDLSVNLHIGGF